MALRATTRAAFHAIDSLNCSQAKGADGSLPPRSAPPSGYYYADAESLTLELQRVWTWMENGRTREHSEVRGRTTTLSYALTDEAPPRLHLATADEDLGSMRRVKAEDCGVPGLGREWFGRR